MIKKILHIFLLLLLFAAAGGLAAYIAASLIIKAEDTIPVPDLIHKEVVYCLEKLSDMGLNTKVKGVVYDSNVPKNYVVHQNPEPGSRIKQGRDVKIVISKGPYRIPAPVLTGLSEREAALVIEENGLRTGFKSRSYHKTARNEEIIAQSPIPGRLIERNAKIDLLISRGPKPVAVKTPNIIGLGLEHAILEIEKAGLTVGKIQNVVVENTPLGKVIDQEPPPGGYITEKRRISIHVARPEPDPRRQSGGGCGLLRYRLDPGFLRRHVRIRINMLNFTGDLYDGFVKPGEEIWVIPPKTEDTFVFVYEDDELVDSRVCGQ